LSAQLASILVDASYAADVETAPIGPAARGTAGRELLVWSTDI